MIDYRPSPSRKPLAPSIMSFTSFPAPLRTPSNSEATLPAPHLIAAAENLAVAFMTSTFSDGLYCS